MIQIKFERMTDLDNPVTDVNEYYGRVVETLTSAASIIILLSNPDTKKLGIQNPNVESHRIEK